MTELLAGRAGIPVLPVPVAVLTMELQRGVMGDLAAFPDLADACARVGVVENTARLLERARRLDLPVVHCTAEFRTDHRGTAVNTPLHAAMRRRSDHLIVGSEKTQVVPELGPADSDLICPRRHGVSPFTGTNLDVTLRNSGVRIVVATGVSVNVAIMGLAIEAANLGYQVVVATDAVAGTPADYAADALRHSIGLVATLATVEEIIGALDELAEAGEVGPSSGPKDEPEVR